jgi:hypothetical protein
MVDNENSVNSSSESIGNLGQIGRLSDRNTGIAMREIWYQKALYELR